MNGQAWCVLAGIGSLVLLGPIIFEFTFSPSTASGMFCMDLMEQRSVTRALCGWFDGYASRANEQCLSLPGFFAGESIDSTEARCLGAVHATRRQRRYNCESDEPVCRFAEISSWMFPFVDYRSSWARISTVRAAENAEFKSFYNHSLEGLLEMNHVCVSIGEGLSGWSSTTQPGSVLRFDNRVRYRGKDETHNWDAASAIVANYVDSVFARSTPPSEWVPASTVAILVPVTFGLNHGHGLHHHLTQLGIADLVDARANPVTSNTENAALIYVQLEGTDVRWSWSERAFAPLLQRPVGGIFAFHRNNSENHLNHIAQTVLRRVPGTFNRSSERIGKTSLCFERLVVAENCHGNAGCRALYHEDEPQSFSFGTLTPLNDHKRRLIQAYRDRAAQCLLGAPSYRELAGAPFRGRGQQSCRIKEWVQRKVPHIFVDVRRSSKKRSFSVAQVADWLIRFVDASRVATISFSDPRFGSRLWQMQRALTSDIYIGFHGGSMSNVALLRNASVVIELVPAGGVFRCNPRWGRLDHCWFAKYSSAIGAKHMVVTFTPKTSPMILWQLVADALCAFDLSLCSRVRLLKMSGLERLA